MIKRPLILSCLLTLATITANSSYASTDHFLLNLNQTLLAKNGAVINQLPYQHMDSNKLFSDFIDHSANTNVNRANIPAHLISEHMARFSKAQEKSFPQLELQLRKADISASERRKKQFVSEIGHEALDYL